MKNKTIVLVLLLFSIFTDPAAPMTPAEIIWKHAASVVLVKTDKGTGTGFFINSCGTIATCWHVIQHANRIQVRWNEKLFEAERIHMDTRYDQALLNIFRRNTPYLQIQKHIMERMPTRQLMKVSDPVIVAGYPFSSERLVATMGKITGVYYRNEMAGGVLPSGILDNITYKTSAVVHPGNSGSPVFDKNGEVIGMATAKVVSGKKRITSHKCFVNSIDRLLSGKEMLFQPSEKGKVTLHKELDVCKENTNPYYFRYETCRRDARDDLYYDCANRSYGTAEHRDVFAGSFLGIPLYRSCRPNIIPRHFSKGTHSAKFRAFLRETASNDELRRLIEK